MPCFDESLNFLRHLYGQCSDYRCTTHLTLTAIHPDGQHHTPSRHIPLNRPNILYDALRRLLDANQLGWGAYAAVGLRRPGLTRYRRGGLAEVVALPALFVDLDRHTLDAISGLRIFSPRPSCIVDSGGGLHAYWWLEQPTTNFDHAGQLLRALARSLDADHTSVAQSLRLPGSTNTKPGRAHAPCRVLDLTTRRYRLADFDHLLTNRDLQTRKSKKPYSTVQTLHTVHRKSRSSADRQLNPDLIRAVTDHLCADYAGHIKQNGYVAALCPCGHVHDAPGKHFNFDPSHGVGLCFGRHGRLLLRDLCQSMGIHPADYGGIFVQSERT